MAELRTYSADTVTATWGIIPLDPGLARGTFIREVRNVPNFRYKDNGYGGVVTMSNSTTSGKLIILINRESKTYQQLLTQANLDFVLRALALPLVIREGGTRTVAIYNQCRPEKVPGLTLSTGPSIVPWTFIFAQTIQQSFGFNNNVAGSGSSSPGFA